MVCRILHIRILLSVPKKKKRGGGGENGELYATGEYLLEYVTMVDFIYLSCTTYMSCDSYSKRFQFLLCPLL